MKFSKRFFFFLSIFILLNMLIPCFLHAQVNTNSYKGLKEYIDAVYLDKADTDSVYTKEAADTTTEAAIAAALTADAKIKKVYANTDPAGTTGPNITLKQGLNVMITRSGDTFEIAATGGTGGGITKIYGDAGDGTGIGEVTIKGDDNISVSQVGNTLEINFLGTIPKEKILVTNFDAPADYTQDGAAEGYYRTAHFKDMDKYTDIKIYRNGILQDYIHDYSEVWEWGDNTCSVTFNYDVSSTEILMGTMFGLHTPSVGP